jgi:hypothetical protein
VFDLAHWMAALVVHYEHNDAPAGPIHPKIPGTED